ncbi:MAG: response regulator [Actinobacteria bacterium]|nr:response regulator [Actinomycetota bacterium]MBU1944979.1 response regulator [Actinomycetota bacterium]MBU2688460.1 response regulator [Actinomycetota bacterium]
MSAKILVVDDDPDIRDVLTELLEGEGYAVVTANDGAQGLEAIREEDPDMVILDLLMPVLDGFGVCKQLQDPRWSKWRDMPVLILTSVREEVSQRRYELETGLSLDVDDYVEKPIDPDVVLERVHNSLARKGLDV